MAAGGARVYSRAMETLPHRARAYLDALRGERVTLDELARAVGASPFHLQRRFKRAFGLSPGARDGEPAVGRVASHLPVVAPVAGRDEQCHAGLRPGLPLEQQREEDLLWIREEFLASDYDWGKTVVFGHTPRTRPLLAPNRIGIATGAVYGRQLTCGYVLSRRCWRAPG